MKQPPLPLRYFVPLFLITAFLAGCIVFLSARALSLRWETSYPEAAVAYNAIRFAATGRLYPSLQEPPYTPVPYPPAYYVILGIGAKIAPGMDAVLRVGRAVSLCSFLLLAVLVYRWSRAAGSGVLLALTGVAFVLSEPDAFPWAATTRPDMLAVLLSLAGLYVLSRRESDSAAALAGLFLSLALLTKQSAFAAPIAAALWLLAARRLRALCVMAAATVIPVLLSLVVLHVHGERLRSNFSFLVAAGTDAAGARGLLSGQFGSLNARFVLLGLALFGAVSALFFGRDRRIALPATYFVVSWIVVLVSIRHVGSSNYYFIEAWTASALVAVFGLDRLHEAANARWAVLAFLVVALFPLARDVREDVKLIRDDGLIRNHELVPAVRDAKVLTDVPYLAAQSRHPEVLDSYFLSILEVKQVWKPVPIIASVAAQGYDLILLGTNEVGMRRYRGFGFLSPAISRQMAVNYRFYCAIQVNDGPGQLGYDTINVAVPKGRRPTNATIEALAEAGCREGTKPALPATNNTYRFILQPSPATD